MQLLIFYNIHYTLLMMFSIFMLIFSGCKEAREDEYKREISFNTPFPKRDKNLHWKLGDRFTLVANEDTLTCEVSFNLGNRYNYIIDYSSGDTLFAGTVSKYKDLYFFDHRINDSSYWISAVDIDKSIFRDINTIAGFGTVHLQMQMLYDSIKKGKYQEMIVYFDTIQKTIKLRPEKDILYSFYSSITRHMARDTLVDLPVRENEEK